MAYTLGNKMPKIAVNDSSSTYRRKCSHMFFETQCTYGEVVRYGSSRSFKVIEIGSNQNPHMCFPIRLSW